MRRRVLLLGATTALALGLAACGGSARSFTAPLPDLPGDPPGPTAEPTYELGLPSRDDPQGGVRVARGIGAELSQLPVAIWLQGEIQSDRAARP